jgi:hypothetical protein
VSFFRELRKEPGQRDFEQDRVIGDVDEAEGALVPGR